MAGRCAVNSKKRPSAQSQEHVNRPRASEDGHRARAAQPSAMVVKRDGETLPHEVEVDHLNAFESRHVEDTAPWRRRMIS